MAGSILVTGRTGQLAAALADTASAHGLTLQCLERPVLDIERPASIAQVFSTHAPSLVINAAAYTNVDAAEDDLQRRIAPIVMDLRNWRACVRPLASR